MKFPRLARRASRARSRKVSVILLSHPSPAERRERGRAARSKLPRRELGSWDADRDALAVVLGQRATRLPDLVPLRHTRMVASPWAFYRGAAAVMAADLATAPNPRPPRPPCRDPPPGHLRLLA